MKRKLRGRGVLAVCLLAMVPLPLLAAATAPPASPEQVADLYLRLFVNQDLQALEQLNAYLAPAYGGQAPFDGPALSQAIAEQRVQEEALVDASLAGMPEAERNQVKQVLLAGTRIVGSTIVNSHCQAVSSQIHPNEATRAIGQDNAEDDIATVVYRCRVPKLDPQLLEGLADGGQASSQQLLLQAQHRLEAGEGDFVEVQGQQDLYRSSGSRIWLTGATDAWLQPVMDSLP